MGDGKPTLFSSNTPLEARFFKFQWNNGQGSVICMLASLTLHFPRPFGNSVELKPPELPKLSLYIRLKHCFLRYSTTLLNFHWVIFLICVSNRTFTFYSQHGDWKNAFLCFNICHSICLTDELQKQ